MGEGLELHTRVALATGITTLLVGTVEILHIGQSHLQGAPTTLTHNELSVANPTRVDVCPQAVNEFFVSNNLAKFHFRSLFDAFVNYKSNPFN